MKNNKIILYVAAGLCFLLVFFRPFSIGAFGVYEHLTVFELYSGIAVPLGVLSILLPIAIALLWVFSEQIGSKKASLFSLIASGADFLIWIISLIVGKSDANSTFVASFHANFWFYLALLLLIGLGAVSYLAYSSISKNSYY